MTAKRDRLPTWRDLPVSDGVPWDNNNHPRQAEYYLAKPLRDWLAAQGLKAFVGVNSFVYYALKKHPKGPDFYVVNGGTMEDQGSWVAWSEGNLLPTLIVELLSPSTERDDRTTKRDFYRTVFKTADYFIYDTENQRFEGWQLHGDEYRPVTVLPGGRVRCQSLPLELGVHGKWLRWYTPDGQLLPTGEEVAAQAQAKAAEAEAKAAEVEAKAAREAARAEEAERRLRELEARLRQSDP